MAATIRKSGSVKRAEQYKMKQQTRLNLERRDDAFASVATVCVLLIWLLLPLFVTNGYFNITDTKAYAFWIIMLIMAVVMAGVWLAFKLGVNRVPLDIHRVLGAMRAQDWAALAFIAIAFISCCCSKYQHVVWTGATARFDGFYTYAGYIALFFIVSRYYKCKNWHVIAFGCVCLLGLVIAIPQYYGVNMLGLYPDGADYFNTQFLSLLGNVNVVSAFSSMTAVYFGYMFIKEPDKKRWFYFAVSMAMFYMQTLAASDSGWVSIGAGILFSLPFVLTDRRSVLNLGILVGCFGLMGFISYLVNPQATYAHTLDAYWLVIAAVGAVVALLALLLGKRVKLKPRLAFLLSCILVVCVLLGGVAGIELLGAGRTEGQLYQAREMLHGNMDNSFMSGRGYIWKTSVKLIPGAPIIGYGLDAVNDAQLDAFGREAEEVIGLQIGKAHNEYLQYAITMGILGLVAYLALVVAVLIGWGKKAYKNDGMEPAKFAAGCSVLGYLAQAVFNFSVVISGPYFWMFLALAGNNRESK